MIIVYAIGLFIGFFTFYQLFFTLASLFALIRTKSSQTPDRPVTKFAILIPAHNEELLIGDLIKSLFDTDYPKDLYHIYVIADNCTDNTEILSVSAGATCLKRDDTSKRGKPYALEWALNKIDISQFDAFSIIDADTTVDRFYLRGMDKALQNGSHAIQGYFGVLNPDENWLTRLSLLPGVLRYKLQCPGKHLLNLSCPLAGNGMCFSAEVINKFGWNAFSIAENWEYYAILTLSDYMVVHEDSAIIYSQVANTLKEGKTQRVRWLRGRIDTLRRYWKRLLKKTLVKRKLLYLDAAIELLRPSHSILFLWAFLFFTFCSVGWYYFAFDKWVFIGSISIFISLVIIFLFGLVVQRAPLKTWLSLGMVPFYLIWKSIVTIKGLFSLNDNKWIKTKRN